MSRHRSTFIVQLACLGIAGLFASAQAGPITDADTGQPILYPSFLTVHQGELYFRGSIDTHTPGTDLWRTSGTSATRISAATQLNPSDLASWNDTLYFESGGKLWQYNSASGATLAPGSSSQASLPQEMFVYDNNLYFRAFRGNIGIELWKFDGANQTPIEMFPGTGSSYPQHFINYNGLMYFNANGTPGQGTELWRYNGSTFTEAARMYPNNGSSPEQMAIYNNRLYFSAYDGVHGRELWSFDGTQAQLAADIVPGGASSSSNPNALAVYNGKLYFSADDGTHGFELWSYDGAAARMVAEINPTPNPGNGDTFLMDSSPAELTAFNGLLYFSADDGVHGRELWASDGTSAWMVQDINPGQYGSGVQELTVFNDQLYFAADDGFIPGLRELQPRMFSIAVPEPGSASLLAGVALALAFRRPR